MENPGVSPRRYKTYILLMVIFLSGVLVGGVGAAVLIKRRAEQFIAGGSESRREAFISRLKRKLELTPEQVAMVDAELAKVQERVGEIHRRYHEEIATVIAQERERIGQSLTPEQREVFRKVIGRMERRLRRAPPPERRVITYPYRNEGLPGTPWRMEREGRRLEPPPGLGLTDGLTGQPDR